MNSALFRSISVVTFANIVILVATFLRSVILARALDPYEFGLALLLITIVGGLDVMQDGGIDQFIVQSRFGTRKDVIAVAQTYRLISATLASLLLIAVSEILAQWLKAPELGFAIKCLAAISILRSLTNVSYKKQQRNQKFSHEAVIDVARFAFEIVVIVALMILAPSYWAVVFSMLANAFVQVFMSNIVFGEDWRAPLNARARRVVGAFALPVTLNSVLLFAAMQGDRLIISNGLNPKQVAIYSAAAAFGVAATAFLARLTASLTLSHFGAGKFRLAARQARAAAMHGYCVVGSTFIGAGLALIVPLLVPLVYGSEYGGQFALVLALSCVNALQIEQGWLTALLTSAGRTRVFPFLTMIRALALPLAAAALALGQPLTTVALAMLIGTQLTICFSYVELAKLKLVRRSGIGLGTARSLAAVGLVAWFSFA